MFYCELGNNNSESGKNGVVLVNFGDDGKTVRQILNMKFVRRTNNKRNDHYFYFAFNKDVTPNLRKRPIVILVEYLPQYKGDSNAFDDKRGLKLQYDAVGDDYASIWKEAGYINFDEFDARWKWVGFNIADGNFRRRQHKLADFRIACRYASPKLDYDLFLKKVMVVPL